VFRTRILIALAAAAALCCAAGCGAQVTAGNAWARATAPGQTIAGAYLKITSTTPSYLVGGSSPVAKAVEIHEMTMENNVMKMRPVSRVELPAGTPVELKPGGYHLMLVDVARPLVKGDSVPLTLIVEDKGGRRHTVEVNAEVTDLVGTGGHPGSR
jgi:copper(I)-binding protein